MQCETPTELVTATKNAGERCGDHLVVHYGDILQTYLAEGDELVVLGPTDLDPPELLRAPLLDRDGDDVQPARSVRSHEVGDIRDSDRLLALVLDALVGAGRLAAATDVDGQAGWARGIDRLLREISRTVAAAGTPTRTG